MELELPIERYTADEYRRWEGDWELIHGVPLAMSPSPALEHQRLSGAIFRQLDEALDECIECEALFEIDVQFSEDTVVRPDVLAICYAPEGERLNRAPELVFEVLSKATARRDEEAKLALYRDEGVKWYILVYPEAGKAKVYRWVEGEYRKEGDFHDERYRLELSKCSIEFDFSRLWRRKAGVQK